MWYSYVCEIYLYSSVDDGDQLQDHIRLDHRQFETAHLRYAVLMTQARYPTVNTIHHPIAMTTDVRVGVLASFPGLHAQLFCRFRTASVDHELGVEARERG